MIGHIRLCLDEIEAEIEAAGFALVGARARELLAQHIEGIRDIVETIEAASRCDASGVANIAAAAKSTVEPTPVQLSAAA